MADVQQVVNFILVWAHGSGEHITNLWLQKLLYFAQGQQLARSGECLFSDRIEAWDYGPVVPNVYHKYKVCGKSPIPQDDEVVNSNVTNKERDLLCDVLRVYGIYSASELSRQSHQTTPWQNAYNGTKHQEISILEMKKYFSDPSRMIQSFDDILQNANIPMYDVRNPDGFFLLPADEDAGEFEDAL